MEYRYNSQPMYYGRPLVAYKRLTVDQPIDSKDNHFSGYYDGTRFDKEFSESGRSMVYFDLSTAATMALGGNTPDSGNSIDFTNPQSNIVTVANGQKRTWTITVKSFTK